jgi:hypothetical protein
MGPAVGDRRGRGGQLAEGGRHLVGLPLRDEPGEAFPLADGVDAGQDLEAAGPFVQRFPR